MANLYRICIHSSVTLEHAWNELEANGIEILYGSEEGGQAELFANLSSPEDLSSFGWMISCTPYTLPSIDWEAQWAEHAENFHDGYVHIDFSKFNRTAPILRLQPGSGFGDLSHPTTRLMLRLLAKHLKKQIVIDIGCGSGILTVAAAAMGAPKAYGIDIDPEALEHSRQNAILNQLEKQCVFCLPENLEWKSNSEKVLILMNMIQNEQEAAWSTLSILHVQSADCITSGIRKEERDRYIAQTTRWGWSLHAEEEEMGWLAFHFISNKKKIYG